MKPRNKLLFSIILLTYIYFDFGSSFCLTNKFLNRNLNSSGLKLKIKNHTNNRLSSLLKLLNSNKKVDLKIKLLDNKFNDFLRNEESIKKIAFIFAKAYLENFAKSKSDRIEIIEINNESINTLSQNNTEYNIKRYLFSNESENHNKFNFKVCIPISKNEKPYIDVFCPFNKCEFYNNFLKGSLSCLREFSPQTTSKLNEISNTYISSNK